MEQLADFNSFYDSPSSQCDYPPSSQCDDHDCVPDCTSFDDLSSVQSFDRKTINEVIPQVNQNIELDQMPNLNAVNIAEDGQPFSVPGMNESLDFWNSSENPPKNDLSFGQPSSPYDIFYQKEPDVEAQKSLCQQKETSNSSFHMSQSKNYSNSRNHHKCSGNAYIYQPSLPQAKSMPKFSKANIYGKGSEARRLKLNCPDYKKPYKSCQIYKKLKERGKANQDYVNQLGVEYNIHFREEIMNNSMPLFNRDQKRNVGVAIWFFEHIYSKIFTWLVETDKISYI